MTVVDIVKKSYVDAQDKKLGFPVVINDADRAAQFPVPLANQRVYNLGAGVEQIYDDAVWKTLFPVAAAFVEDKPYNAVGDYNSDTDIGTDDTVAINAALAASSTIVLGKNKKYRVTAEINNTNKQIIWNGSEIYRTDGGAGFVLNAEGIIGAFSNLDVDAVIGQNVVQCAALAATLKEGDMVKVRSDKLFNVLEGVFEGEIAIVQDVNGANIRFSKQLRSTYNVADVARIALITPDRSSHIGTARVRRQRGYAVATSGLRVHLALNPQFAVSVLGAKSSSIVISDCYAPTVDFFVENGANTTASVGYGMSLENATMDAIVRGQAFNCRHAVNTGAAPAYGGVVWGAKVKAFGSTLGSTAIFNSHAATGSVDWDDCIAEGGSHTRPDGVVATPSAFNLGAKYNKIRNARAIRCATIVSMDTSVSATDRIETIDIDGIEMVDCTGAAFNIPAAWTGIIGRLSVWNVKGKGSGLSLAQWTTIEQWDFGNFYLQDSGVGITNTLFRVAGTGACPAIFKMQNGNFEGPAVPAALATTDRGSSIANANVTETIWTGSMKKKSLGLRIETALTRLRLGVDFDQNYAHVYCTAAPPTEIWLQGGSFRRSQHALATWGALALTIAGTVAKLVVQGVGMDTDPYVAGHTSSVQNIVHGGNDLTGATAVARNLAAGWLEYLAGSIAHPRLLRGAGSPAAVVAAPKGCMFERSDGAVGSMVYYNNDGATGWTALP